MKANLLMPKQRTKPNRKRITKAVVTAAKPRQDGRDHLVWDTEIKGFGIVVKPSGHKAFIFRYRNATGRERRMKLGSDKQLSAAEARKEAKKAAGDVAKGRDPLELRKSPRGAPTVRDLAARFTEEHAPKRSASTQRNYRILWDRHLIPALGSKAVREVKWEDIARLHYRMRKTPYLGNRMLALASKAWSLAARWGWWLREIPNPAREHDRHPEDRERGSALSPEQLQAVGEALALDDRPSAEAARLCMLSGARPSEIRLLRWEDLEPDGRVAELPASKTGKRKLYFGSPAAEVIARQPRRGEFVFPAAVHESSEARGSSTRIGRLSTSRLCGRVLRSSQGLNLRFGFTTRHDIPSPPWPTKRASR
jgi:integrase